MNFGKLIPAFYWPTELVFIDDDEMSARMISKLFNANPTKIFSNSNHGIQYINQQNTHVSEEDEWAYDLDLPAEYNQIYTIRNVFKKLYQVNRHHEISTVIIDYDMPQINGLSAIDNIQNAKIKKILLTGVADESLAVKAFNQGKINRYIKKLSENADLISRDYVFTLQMKYFTDCTKNIISKNQKLQSLLQNIYFINFFANIIAEKNIVEFYLLDEYGSFLLLDASGNFYCLIIHAAEVLDGVLHLIKDSGSIKKNTILKLTSKEKLIPYLAVELIDRDHALVEKYIVDCDKIPGTDLYFAMTTELAFLNIDFDKVTFFNKT